jgi:hypothetical protein
MGRMPSAFSPVERKLEMMQIEKKAQCFDQEMK